jgi:hypothetical protein
MGICIAPLLHASLNTALIATPTGGLTGLTLKIGHALMWATCHMEKLFFIAPNRVSSH